MDRKLIALSAVLAVPGLAACGDGGGTSTVRVTASDSAAMRQALAAMPLEEFDSICLNVVSVRVRIDADDPDDASHHEGEDGWYELALAEPEDDGTEPTDPNTEVPPCPLDLAALLRGEKIELAWGEVPSGDMTQLRFVLADDQGYAIRAGETWNERIPVLVPSGSQSGLKFVGPPIALEPDEEEEVELVFDAEASIREHNGGAVRIRPVVHIRGADSAPEDGAGGEGGEGGAGGTGGSGGEDLPQ